MEPKAKDRKFQELDSAWSGKGEARGAGCMVLG